MSGCQPQVSLLPSPADFAKDKGPIGQLLRLLPPWMLAEASIQKKPWPWLARKIRGPIERRKEGPASELGAAVEGYMNAGFERVGVGVYRASEEARRSTKIREIRFCYHKGHPGKRIQRVIMDAYWPSCFRKTFEAAASQHLAVRRLVEVARGGGSIHKSYLTLLKEARFSGNQSEAAHWGNKIAASILRMHLGRRLLMESPRTPTAVREEAKRLYDRFYEADVRRLGRKEADERWKGKSAIECGGFPFKLNSDHEVIAVAMTLGWLAVDNTGFPGFGFFSDNALEKLFAFALKLSHPPAFKTIRSIRERLGLVKAGILIVKVEPTDSDKWVILDRRDRKFGQFEKESFSTGIAGRKDDRP